MSFSNTFISGINLNIICLLLLKQEMMVIGLCTVTDGNKLYSDLDVLDFYSVIIVKFFVFFLSLIYCKLSSVALFRMVIFT